ncbi:hypothetical protein ABH999_004279 [Bradyrhizobium yuanmingense]|uniref:hypothetical protein n=1 Tax=Bradyrhizobium yuanmingense TaxID=108015 RepID=UPI00055DD38F|nr:hypothetical protein [Bradyrhizobium yuanmingense]
MSGWHEELQKQGGCGLLMMAWGVFALGYMIYWLVSGGSPENKKFFDDCYRRETRGYTPGDIPDPVVRSAVAECTNQQREHLGLPNLNIKAVR